MASRIPPLLEPYLGLPPESSLILLTSVLGASSNWLLLRSLYSYLRGSEGNEDVGVVLVSFLRDGSFWREGSGKLGLDLDALSRAGRFGFVDGVTGAVGDAGLRKDRTLRSLRLGDVKKEIEAAVSELRSATKILVIDQLDAYLALTTPETTSLQLQDLVLSLRERVHATVLSLAADRPLVAAQQTTLEREHASLVLAMAHAAARVLMCRMLDTGTARDVSGVVRVGGEAEFLYYVAADGGVRVFERGT